MTEEERFEQMQDWLMEAKRNGVKKITVNPVYRSLLPEHRLSVTKLAGILDIDIHTDGTLIEGEYVGE